MNLENQTKDIKPKNKTNLHFSDFILGVGMGAIVEIAFGDINKTPLLNSIIGGSCTSILDKYVDKIGWAEAYEHAPARIVGIYCGMNLLKFITQ